MDESGTDWKHFESGAKALAKMLDAAALQRLADFENLLVEENEKTNLTAIRNRADIRRKHFLDSLTVLAAIPESAASVADIGSGAGFPGIPVAIARPGIRMALLESNGKKAAFLQKAVDLLGLQNVEVLGMRAEDVGRDPKFRGAFDAALARAVAPLAVLSEYALPLLKTGGVFIAQKSAGETEEEAGAALSELGGRIRERLPIALAGLSPRELVIIEKTAETPEKYPRRTGMPSKRPL